MNAQNIIRTLELLKDEKRARTALRFCQNRQGGPLPNFEHASIPQINQWFARKPPLKRGVEYSAFKTEKGEYGEGDQFWGITVPECRKIAKQYFSLPLAEITTLLCHPIHECRLTALLILVKKYQKADEMRREDIVDYYLQNTKYINNWDLVDLTADKILGAYLIDKDKTPLTRLARSTVLWERRIAIIATYYFIRQGQSTQTLDIAKILLHDQHDLIHKAVGWMLREIGKRDKAREEEFLKEHYLSMPRTMLRYAIEKFPEEERKEYLRV
ncbi:DNA alkylation repair protein [Candidatus Woesearchaeota archaeon]|nr:DNA alkylation repair protein [Candidatus Woesearchaeota archaeon]